MFPKGLKVLFVSAEVVPFSAAGGLGQVAYFLPRALLKLGIDVRIFSPKYGLIDEKRFPTKMISQSLKVPTYPESMVGDAENFGWPKELICNVKVYGEAKKNEPTVYFLENQEYFEKRANVYGYSDDHIRFGLLSRGALEFIKTGIFVPNLIHANDWHTGYLINFLRENYRDDPNLKKIATLFSIHNLHQGGFDFAHASEMDFDDGKSPLASFFSEQYYKQNALKRGVMYSDIVNTVSETYAREILSEEYGRGLHNLFRELRGKISGILNGLDYKEFNPQTDKVIKKNYSVRQLNGRAENKADLQKIFGLEINPHIPLITYWGRLDSQKGIDLIKEDIRFIMDEFPVQFIIQGPSENYYRDFFCNLEKEYPGRVGTHLMWDPILPRKLASGADILLQPSAYEPGGIVALEAMRYGLVPIVRATGGLADSVIDYDPLRNIGTGFTFKKYDSKSLLVAIVRALETYKNRDQWQRIVRRGMEQDFSWEKVAGKYQELYDKALTFRKDSLLPNPPTAYRQLIA